MTPAELALIDVRRMIADGTHPFLNRKRISPAVLAVQLQATARKKKKTRR